MAALKLFCLPAGTENNDPFMRVVHNRNEPQESCVNYYLGGMLLPGKNYNPSTYTHGFNGQMKDEEWNSNGNSIDYIERGYDSRIVRFRSVDPLTKLYPWYSPYQFAGNKPIQAVDLDGKEEFFVTDYKNAAGELYKTEIRVVNHVQGGENDAYSARQKVHRSEVTFDDKGNAIVTYAGSYEGTATGKNAFASDAEREYVLGTRQFPNGNKSSYIVPYEKDKQANKGKDVIFYQIVTDKDNKLIKEGKTGQYLPDVKYNDAEAPDPAKSAYIPQGTNAVPVNPSERINKETGKAIGGSTTDKAQGSEPKFIENKNTSSTLDNNEE